MSWKRPWYTKSLKPTCNTCKGRDHAGWVRYAELNAQAKYYFRPAIGNEVARDVIARHVKVKSNNVECETCHMISVAIKVILVGFLHKLGVVR